MEGEGEEERKCMSMRVDERLKEEGWVKERQKRGKQRRNG